MIRPAGPDDEAMVDKAIRHEMGDEWWTYDEMVRSIATGERQVWIVNGAVCITRVLNGRTLLVEALYGEGVRDWIAEVDAFMRGEARRRGLSQVAARGRRGFHALAKAQGWRETHREYRVDVT